MWGLGTGIWSMLLVHNKESESEVAQSCPTLCDPMNGSLSGSSIHGIFQGGVLEWIATSFSRGIFPTQELNLGLPHCRQMLYRLSRQGSPDLTECLAILFVIK